MLRFPRSPPETGRSVSHPSQTFNLTHHPRLPSAAE
jgi:hypothetical protein